MGAKFYCPHGLAGGNYCIQIREKMLEFSSAVLPAPSLYYIPATGTSSQNLENMLWQINELHFGHYKSLTIMGCVFAQPLYIYIHQMVTAQV